MKNHLIVVLFTTFFILHPFQAQAYWSIFGKKTDPVILAKQDETLEKEVNQKLSSIKPLDKQEIKKIEEGADPVIISKYTDIFDYITKKLGTKKKKLELFSK